jgi:hypothetical protein
VLGVAKTWHSGERSVRIRCVYGARLILTVLWVGCAAPAQRAATAPPPPHLECTCTSAGDSTTVRVDPTPDAYGAREIPLGDRFAMKFVYLTSPADVAGLRIYTFQTTNTGPVLVHQAKYWPPFARGPSFTGRQLVYDARGGELAYTCAWIAP